MCGGAVYRIVIHVTRDLLTVLLDHAAERDPAAVNLQLSATRAESFEDDTGLDPRTPVLTQFEWVGTPDDISSFWLH